MSTDNSDNKNSETNLDSASAVNASPKKRWWQGGFFNRMDYLAFGISFLISFIIYAFTTAPSVTLEDSGELAVAGDYLGVPHPPGYPLWTICAFVFTRIFRFVTYMGQPNPAWAIGLMSGFFGALAAGITAMLINKCAKELISHAFGANENESKCSRIVLSASCLVAAIAGSLAFAFSPVEWSQSTIIEVYTLNSFFLMLIFLFIFKWLCKPSVKLLWLVAFLFGLGFTNYQVLLFMAVPMVIAVMLHSIPLFRDFILIFIPIGFTIKLMQLAAKFPEPGFAKMYTMQSNGGVPQVDPKLIDKVSTHYLIAIISILVICVVAVLIAYIVRCNKNNVQPAKLFRYFASNMIFLKIAFAIATVVLFLVIADVPTFEAPANFSLVPKSEQFSFNSTYLLFALAAAVLFGFGACFAGGLWYAGTITAILLSLLVFVAKGYMLGLTHPLSPFFWVYVSLNIIYLLLAWAMLPNGRAVAGTVLFAELGAAFYGYMPLASDTNPPMNWGFPKTWEGFKHAVSRGQYEKIVPITLSQVLSPNFVRQLGSYFTDLRMQFTLILAPLGFIPFALWSIKIKNKRIKLFPVAFGLAAAIAVLAALDKLIDPTGANSLGGAYKFLMGLIFVLATIGVALIVIRILHVLFGETLDKTRELGDRIISGLCFLGISLGVIISIYCVSNICAEYILETSFGILEPVIGVASVAEMSRYMRISVLLSLGISIVLSSIFVLMTVFSQKKMDFIRTEHSDVSCKWFVITLIAFLMMSVVLIGMANPKGDIQDNFIQKVKFISSHAIFAIWIGYGIAMSVYLFRKQRYLFLPAVAVCAMLFVIPIRENYLNADMVDITSAAEQNGHDFGWQFGNYQLRGAEAIIEELLEDEEPLPNPEYPSDMTPNAIFFGGTDPGRFVPTYMIYSAKVRPDVFLITQNALADPTYMDTMRSLYADQIWMPTAKDNSDAFDKYIRLVQTGELPNLGGISDKNGRIQVNGAMEVMEINAIITEQIFNKNIASHDFYVEESYAMRWMNPYLTPHGLIMKLNAKQQSQAEFNKTLQDDMDFWDWYTRRLTSNPGYERDVAARRSFSKLRASLAGLYANRRMIQAAERAYIDGLLLYPYSPECTIRFMREMLYPYGRIDDSILYVEKLVYKDKNNQQAQAALKMLKELKQAEIRIRSMKDANDKLLVEYNKANPNAQIKEDILILPDEDMLEMVKAANVLGNTTIRYIAVRDYFSRKKLDDKIVVAMLEQIIGFQGVSIQDLKLIEMLPQDFFEKADVETLRIGADAYIKMGNAQKAMNFLAKILSKDANDWRSWTSYSLILLQTTRDPNRSAQFLIKGDQAARACGEHVKFRELIASIPELKQLYGLILQQQSQSPQGLPMGMGPTR